MLIISSLQKTLFLQVCLLHICMSLTSRSYGISNTAELSLPDRNGPTQAHEGLAGDNSTDTGDVCSSGQKVARDI